VPRSEPLLSAYAAEVRLARAQLEQAELRAEQARVAAIASGQIADWATAYARQGAAMAAAKRLIAALES
jgi:multidrug resistance efflux pump